MSLLLEHSLDSLSQVEGGLVCARAQNVFTYNPIQQITRNGQCKNFNEIGSSIMALDHNCTEQLIVFSCTWHKIVDIETGRKVREIYDQDGFVSAVCWSPTNPNIFASTGTDSSIRTWDIRAHPAQTLQLRRQRRYKSIVYSPDSNFLAFAGESINLVELTNPRNVFQINCPSPVTSVRFNPVEYLLATSSEDRVIRFYDIDSTECVSQSLPFESNVKNIDFDSQGSSLIASCRSVISAFNWEPFECVGRLDLSSSKDRNLPGGNSVPISDGSSNFRHNSTFKSLDTCVLNNDILQLSFDESEHKLLLHLTNLEELCASVREARSPVKPLELTSNISDFIESPTQWDTSPNRSTPVDQGVLDKQSDSAIGTIQSLEVTRDRRQSTSETCNPKQKSSSVMTGSCCLSMDPMVSNKLPPNFLGPDSALQKLPRPQNLTVSHLENKGQRPTKAKSNVRLSAARDARGSNSMLSQRTPSVEAVNSRLHDEQVKPTIRTPSSKAPSRQPITPVDDKPTISFKRNGSVPNDSSAHSAAEKHAMMMEILNSRIRDCKRINLLLKSRNGEDEALDEAVRMNDGLHMFAQILRSYKQQPTAYSLQFCARVTPTLRVMLTHKNSSYVDLALDTLANILNEFIEPIKHALAPNAVSIGVDLAAEQRHMHCTSCKQALTELYLNSSFVLEKLSPPQRDYFNMLLPMIEQISGL